MTNDEIPNDEAATTAGMAGYSWGYSWDTMHQLRTACKRSASDKGSPNTYPDQLRIVPWLRLG